MEKQKFMIFIQASCLVLILCVPLGLSTPAQAFAYPQRDGHDILPSIGVTSFHNSRLISQYPQSFNAQMIFDGGTSVRTTTDGGYIVFGFTQLVSAKTFEEPYTYALLIKFNSLGAQEWNTTFAGRGAAFGFSCEQTTDGGFIVAGYTATVLEGDRQMLLVKTDSHGATQWEKTYQILKSCEAHAVQQTDDGGYILVGQALNESGTYQQLVLLKTDDVGNELWVSSLNGGDFAEGRDVSQTNDGGYIMTGTVGAYNPDYTYQAVLIKTNETGDLVWNQSFSVDGVAEGLSVCQALDEGYLLSGATALIADTETTAFFIKTGNGGNVVWTKTFPLFRDSEAMQVLQTDDQDFVFIGNTMGTSGSNLKVLLVKTTNAGGDIWNKTFPFPGYHGIGYSLDTTQDLGFILTGFIITAGGGDMEMDGILLKTNSIGAEEWITFFEWRKPDTTPPTVSISQPEPGIYVKDALVLSFPVPLVIGQITVKAMADDEGYGINRVEFFVDHQLQATVGEAPYHWIWSSPMFFRHTLTVVAYDNAGLNASVSLVVWKLF